MPLIIKLALLDLAWIQVFHCALEIIMSFRASKCGQDRSDGNLKYYCVLTTRAHQGTYLFEYFVSQLPIVMTGVVAIIYERVAPPTQHDLDAAVPVLHLGLV